MESRPLPQWARTPVSGEALTAVEILVRRVGEEVHNRGPVTIIGAPWVNPKGTGRTHASVGDYLRDPTYLFRALAVAFLGVGRSPAQSALIVADASLHSELDRARDWVQARSASELPCERIVWVALEPEIEELLRPDPVESPTHAGLGFSPERAAALPLAGAKDPLAALCGALAPLFE